MNYTVKIGDKQIPIVPKRNYKIIMTYSREEIITNEQFVKLAAALFDKDTEFVFINGILVQKQDIRMAEPTFELTAEQEKRNQQTVEDKKALTDKRNDLMNLKATFDLEFYNTKYPEGWTINIYDTKQHVISAEDRQECWNAFVEKYPDESEEINLLSNSND